jgi:hypothetical protein
MSIKNLSILLALTVPLMAMDESPQVKTAKKTANMPQTTNFEDQLCRRKQRNKLNELKQQSNLDAKSALIDAVKCDQHYIASYLLTQHSSKLDQEDIDKAFKLIDPRISSDELFLLFIDQPEERRPHQKSIDNAYINITNFLKELNADQAMLSHYRDEYEQLVWTENKLREYVSNELKKPLEKQE